MNKVVLWTLVALSLGVALPRSLFAAPASPATVDYQALPKPGKKVPLGATHYFTFGFVKEPKLGTAIMRVEIFTLDGARDTSFTVKGDADMPSMRGAHSSGDKTFVLSAKGVYLLPMQLVMPGGWEIRFTLEKAGATTFHGAYLFDL